MKPSDFITENHHIIQAVQEMHDDHEVQMAREQCYNAASNAIELHRLLKQINEREGLEGWVQEKITLANDYLRQVREWMEHDLMSRANETNLVMRTMGESVTAGATGSSSIATAIAAPVVKMKKPKVIKRKQD